MSPRRAYRTDLSDARWALIEPVLAAWRAARAEAGLGLRGPVHDLREIVNAILYVNRTGIAWEYLPHDFPPFKTVYDYYAKWEAGGLTEAIHGELRRKVRKAAGRSAEPSAAILDAQSIRTSGNVPESSQGIDAGKKIKGRKRHIATDTLGLLLVLLVTAASVQDTTGGRDVVSELDARHPGVASGGAGWGRGRPAPATRAWPGPGRTAVTSAASSRPAPRTASTSRSSARIPARKDLPRYRSGGPLSVLSAGGCCIAG